MKRTSQISLTSESVVDQLYDVALDPVSLEGFIVAWNAAGLDTKAARETLESFATFDKAYAAHLKRADIFFGRGEEPPTTLTTLLAPFENLAVAIFDSSLNVVACNAGATRSLGLAEGDDLRTLQADSATLDGFTETLQELFLAAKKPDLLLKMGLAQKPLRPCCKFIGWWNPAPMASLSC